MTTHDSILARAIASALSATCRATVDGFAGKRGLDDAVTAEVDFHGRAVGKFAVVMPRTLLPALFGNLVAREGSAELEVLGALGELGRVACLQALRAHHDTAYGFTLGLPRTGPAAAPSDGEIVVRVGGSWLAVNLIEA